MVVGSLLVCATGAVMVLSLATPARARTAGRSRERAGLTRLPAVVPLASCWRETPGARALKEFTRAFDGTLRALRTKLSDRHGRELASTMSVHQQVSFAGEFGIWSAGELADWRRSLTLRSEILTEGHAVPHDLLAQHTARLEALSRRTRRHKMS